MLKDFDKLFHKTGLSKLKQIIEQTNILLESKCCFYINFLFIDRISFVFVAYHSIILEAVKESLNKS